MMDKKLMAATALAMVLAMGTAACGSSDEGGSDETPTTEAADSSGDESTTTTEADDATPSGEAYEPSGEKTVYGGIDIEITGAEVRESDPDEGEPEDVAVLSVELEVTSGIEDGSVQFYTDDTELLIGDESFDVSASPSEQGNAISLDGGDSAEWQLDFYDVPADASFDDMVLLIAEGDRVPAVLPFTGSAESPLPVSMAPDQTLQLVDGSGVAFDMVIDEVSRSWDLVTSDTGLRAEDDTTFLRFDLTITSGTEQVCISGDFFRLAAGGEVNPTIGGSTLAQCIEPNSQKEAIAYLILPDDATDPVVRIGAPENDPEYTEWPVPLDELGGEIDLDTILDEILSGESSSSDDEGDDSSSSDDEDDDESTTTTEG